MSFKSNKSTTSLKKTKPGPITYGVLGQQAASRLGHILSGAIDVPSNIPDGAGEGEFPTLQCVPAHMTTSLATRLRKRDISSDVFFVGDWVSRVVASDPAVLDSNKQQKGEDQEEEQQDLCKEDTIKLMFRLKGCTERDFMSEIRDIFLAVVRDMTDGACDEDTVPDHLLAGAYIHQMTVINAPDLGEEAFEAVFSLCSGEDVPKTVVFHFCGSPIVKGPMVDNFGFPTRLENMFELTKGLDWLSSMKPLSRKSGRVTPEDDSGVSISDADSLRTVSPVDPTNGGASNGPDSTVPSARPRRKSPHIPDFLRFRMAGALNATPGCSTIVVNPETDIVSDVGNGLHEIGEGFSQQLENGLHIAYEMILVCMPCMKSKDDKDKKDEQTEDAVPESRSPVVQESPTRSEVDSPEQQRQSKMARIHTLEI